MARARSSSSGDVSTGLDPRASSSASDCDCSDTPSGSHADSHFAFHGHYIVPGFIDVHLHGVDGVDSLDRRAEGDDAVAAIAARLPRYGAPGVNNGR